METLTQLKLVDLVVGNRFYINNPIKSTLKKRGFRYDTKCSTKDCECYIYEFPVIFYKKTPVITCCIRVYMDNGEVTIDIHNGFGLIPAWYQKDNPQFTCHRKYISKIDRQIVDKLNIFGVLTK